MCGTDEARGLEVKWLTQGHGVNERRRWDSEPHLAPSPFFSSDTFLPLQAGLL